MKAQELRVGNYITSKAWKGHHQIDGIQITDEGFELTIGNYIHKFQDGMYVDIDPIPLTPEILEKFGFTLKSSGEWYDVYSTKNKLHISMAKVNIPTGFNAEKGKYYIGEYHTEISSLHWLQNYVYFVFGFELSINFN